MYEKVSALRRSGTPIPVGGPVTYTHRENAELAFAALGKQPKVRREPVWLMWS